MPILVVSSSVRSVSVAATLSPPGPYSSVDLSTRLAGFGQLSPVLSRSLYSGVDPPVRFAGFRECERVRSVLSYRRTTLVFAGRSTLGEEKSHLQGTVLQLSRLLHVHILCIQDGDGSGERDLSPRATS